MSDKWYVAPVKERDASLAPRDALLIRLPAPSDGHTKERKRGAR